ncbi:MAG TPA: GlsB/YeaQ/YmgE family stress response membrane protein [Candidatus Polarisedimenticolaceae bacterium]|nr:GlsB/YeaQ/YmgE family stress response membrane protein [Candidatus Polarisedimenticolaceae bacterium]
MEGPMYVVWWIVVGLMAGWATGKIMRGAGYGVLMDIGLGIIGAVVGGMLMRSLGFTTSGGLIPAILVAILGAVVVVALVRLLRKV